jgi:glycosyltransferase involved in cell wall biosynthesis
MTAWHDGASDIYTMRVAIIEPIGGHGGMNYYDFELAAGLVAAGAEVTLYTCDITDVPPLLPFKVSRTFKKIWGDGHKSLRALRFVFSLLHTLFDARKKKIKLVHYHFFHYTILELFTITSARLLRFKIVVTTHDIESFTGRNSIKTACQLLKKTDEIIAHNHVSKNELIMLTGFPVDRVKVIPHGNYLNSVHPTLTPVEARKKLNMAPDIPVLLFFGQIKTVKGLDVLLQALPAVIAEFPKLKLVIAGKVWKDDFSIYDKLIQKKNIQENIELHIKYIPNNEVGIFYRSADLIILPYKKIYQSGVLLMAMSYGLPAIASDIDGMAHVVTDGLNGFLFSNNSVEGLSDKIIYALSNPRLLKKISQAGLEKMKKDHNWSEIGEQTFNLYRTLLHRS